MTDDSPAEKASSDLDIIATTAEEGLAELEAGNATAAAEALRSIRDRAGAWDGPD